MDMMKLVQGILVLSAFFQISDVMCSAGDLYTIHFRVWFALLTVIR